MRRASLSDFFSTASIAKIEPLIVRHVSVLCDQIEILAIKGQPVRLSSAFSCLTASIAHEFAFSKSPNFLLNPDFETPFGRAFAASFVWTGFVKHTPWFFTLMDSISESVGEFVGFSCLIELQASILQTKFRPGVVRSMEKGQHAQ